MMCDETIKKYVWGELSAVEQENFEEEYFQDGELLDALIAYSENLMSAYITQAMPLTEREKFATRLQSLPFLLEQTAIGQSLGSRHLQATADSLPSTHSHTPPPKNNWFSAYKQWKLFPPFALGFSLLALLALVFWWIQKTPPPIAQQQNPATIQSPLQSTDPPVFSPSATTAGGKNPPVTELPTPKSARHEPVNAPANLAMILLSPFVTRGESQTPELVLAPAQTQVQIELELPDNPAKSYRLELHNSNGQILKIWSNVPPLKSAPPIVRVRVSAALLTLPSYEIVLLNEDTQERQPYPFQVARK